MLSLKTIHFAIRGVSPLLAHNRRLADPRDPIVRQMKEITSKRKKTDADHEQLSRLEFMGGLYCDAEVGLGAARLGMARLGRARNGREAVTALHLIG